MTGPLISRQHVLNVLDMANADERLREAIMGLPKVEAPTHAELSAAIFIAEGQWRSRPTERNHKVAQDAAASAILALLTPGGDPPTGSRP